MTFFTQPDVGTINGKRIQTLNSADNYTRIELCKFGRVNFHYFERETGFYAGSINYLTYDIKQEKEGLEKTVSKNVLKDNGSKFQTEKTEKTINGKKYLTDVSKNNAYWMEDSVLCSATKVAEVMGYMRPLKQIDEFLQGGITFKTAEIG